MFEKIACIISILIGVIVANSCSLFVDSTPPQNQAPYKETQKEADYQIPDYGNYLAGRVAHIRHDLNRAADFYKKVVTTVPDQQMLASQLYIMLISQGRIDEAVRYAKLAQEKGDESPFIYTLEAIQLTKQKQYSQAIEILDKTQNKVAETFFNPLILAWNYAGLKDGKKALKALSPLVSNQALKPLYLFQAGAINDYLGNTKAAEAHYTALMNIKHIELSVFPLQVIANFYIRNGEPDKALRAATLAINQNNLMMRNIVEEIKKSDSETKPILFSPEIGLGDALFNIAVLLQQEGSNNDLAILFASLSAYCSPDYPLPYLLTASLLEKRELYAQAITYYQKIPSKSYAYYNARFQIGKNYMHMGNTKKAEEIFRDLYNSYPPNPDILTNLGEVARANRQYTEAATFYQKAIDSYPKNSVNDVWPLYFAIGVSYSAAGDNVLAEKYLRKVLDLKPNKLTQNHLGYILLVQNKNIEEAFELIVTAYNPRNDDGTVTDSVGWAFFKIGNYEEAVNYLEKAANLAPSEALICDHLGDAYWMAGRKREAIFQWNHALKLKDETGEFKREVTEQKIKEGLLSPSVPDYDRKKIEKQTEKLKNKEKKN